MRTVKVKKCQIKQCKAMRFSFFVISHYIWFALFHLVSPNFKDFALKPRKLIGKKEQSSRNWALHCNCRNQLPHTHTHTNGQRELRGEGCAELPFLNTEIYGDALHSTDDLSSYNPNTNLRLSPWLTHIRHQHKLITDGFRCPRAKVSAYVHK